MDRIIDLMITSPIVIVLALVTPLSVTQAIATWGFFAASQYLGSLLRSACPYEPPVVPVVIPYGGI